jgi:hypothetical protein
MPLAEPTLRHRELDGLELALFLTGELALMNLVLVLRLADAPSREQLDRPLRELQRRHPILRSRVVREGGGYRFETGGVPAVKTRVVDRKGDNEWLKLVEQELVHGFDSLEGPLIRALLVRPRGGRKPAPGEILLTLNHAIADGPACKEIVSSLLAALEVLPARDGQETDDQPFPPGVEERFPASFRGARRLAKMSDFIARQAADEALYRLRTLRRRPTLETGLCPCRILTRMLDEACSRELPRACARNRVTINSALQAAALIAVDRQLYGGRKSPLRFVEFPDLRPYLDPPPEPSTVANYSSTVRFTVSVEGSLDLWKLAAEVQGPSHRAYRRGDKFCSAVSSPTMIRTLLRQDSVRMGNTALSYTGPMLLDPDPGPERVVGLHAFVSNFPLGPEYTAQVRWLRGQLQWDVVFLDSDMDRPLAESVLDEMFALLASAVGSTATDREQVLA